VFLHVISFRANYQTNVPRRRGFDVLLDTGFSPADVANMRQQFYLSRGEEMPEGLDVGDVSAYILL
jgi:hypothetical protein